MNTTWRAPLALSFAVIVLSWLTFRYIYSPQENDFLAAIEAHYLKVASERNFQNKISYSDCIVQDGGAVDRKNGVERFGVCEFNDNGSTYQYFAALSENAKIVYWNLEVK